MSLTSDELSTLALPIVFWGKYSPIADSCNYDSRVYKSRVVRHSPSSRITLWLSVLPYLTQAALDDAGGPEAAVGIFYGCTGHWEAYRLKRCVDVYFYRFLWSTLRFFILSVA